VQSSGRRWAGVGMRSRRTARAAAALIAATQLLAACHGSRPSSGPGGSPSAAISRTAPSNVAFSACMRTHGVPNFPDPDIKGMPAPAGPRQLGVSPARYQVAEQTCLPLLPAGGSLQQQTQRCVLYGECPQPLVQHLLTVERHWAQCLRFPTVCRTGPIRPSAPRVAVPCST